MSAIDILTRQDLQQFKEELLAEMQKMTAGQTVGERRWLKTYEVRKMLGDLSPGTMQTMRNSSLLPYTILNGLALYEYNDVGTLMDELKTVPKRRETRLLR